MSSVFADRAARRPSLKPLTLAALLVFMGSSQVWAQSATDATDTTATPAAAKKADTATPATASLQATTVTDSTLRETPQNLKQKVSNGALGERSQLDTPFSTTVVSQEQLEARQATKIGEVFANDASVSDGSSAYDAWAGYIYVRGAMLDWQNGYKIDGLPLMTYGSTMPYEHFERVELLKGLSGFMYGFVTPGGVVNYVTKKPTDERLLSVDVGYHSKGIWREHIDAGGHVGPNDIFGYRFNYTHEEGTTYNNGKTNRDSLSLALDARITRDLTWTFNSLYQDTRTTGLQPSIYVGYAGGLPKPINIGDANLTGSGTFLNTTVQMYSTGLHYQINDDWKVSADYAYATQTRNRNEATLSLSSQSGAYTGSRVASDQLTNFNQFQVTAEGKVRTGPFQHQLVFGVAYQRQTNDYSGYNYSSSYSGNLYTGDSFSFSDPANLPTNRYDSVEQKAAFISDTVQLTDRWSVLAGARVTNYSDTSATGANIYTKNGIITPTFAVMYKLTPSTTLYASYVEALEAGQIVGTGYSNVGAILNPVKSRQYEVGAKTEHSGWSATAALFRMERGSTYTTSDNSLSSGGKSIYQGLELSGTVKLGTQWLLGASAMVLNTHYSEGIASIIGHRVAGAPRYVFASNLEYKVPFVPGLSVGVDAKFNGNTELNAANTVAVTGFTVINAGATYRTRIASKDVTLRAGVANLTNRKYWEYQYEGYVKPGDPRTFAVNAKLDF